MVYAFVVLHYMSVEDTIECVNSIIQSIKSSINYYIIVVDNGSPDNSIRILKNKLIDSRIIIIHNENNLGFAKGNNVGFQFAKQKLHADFIALVNNDTCIYQENWIEKCIELYNKYHYAVLGPDIINLQGEHLNPYVAPQWTVNKLRIARIKQYVKIFLLCIGITINRPRNIHDLVCKNTLNENLHGACLIFSPIYVKHFDGLYDKTFLYMEEDILILRLKKYNMNSLYSPELKILHKEDRSTIASSSSTKEMEIKKIKNWIDSSIIYENLIRK